MNEPLWSAALQMRAQGKTVIFSFLAVLLAEIQFCSDLRVFQAKIIAQNKRMCGSRKYPYPPHGRLFDLHPPLPPGFSLPGGSLMTPPPLRNFQKFCTYKKESKYQLSYVNTIEFYYNSVNIKVNFNKNITLC